MAFLHRATNLLRSRIIQNRTLNRQLFTTSYALCSKDAHEDFFGFGDSKEEITSNNEDKMEYFKKPVEDESSFAAETSTYQPPPDTDRVLVANFGTVRVDSIASRDDFDHTPVTRKSSTKLDHSIESGDMNFIDEQYFGDFARDAVHRFTRVHRSETESETASLESKSENETIDQTEDHEDLNYFDEVLVNMSASEVVRSGQSPNSTIIHEDLKKYDEFLQNDYNKRFVIDKPKPSKDLGDLNYFDELLLKEPTSTIDPESEEIDTKNVSTRDIENDVDDLNYFDQMLLNRDPEQKQIKPTKIPKPKPNFDKESFGEKRPSRSSTSSSESMPTSQDAKSTQTGATSTKSTEKSPGRMSDSPSLKEAPPSKAKDRNKPPDSALEYAQQLRDETNPVKRDSRGYLIPTQVKDLSRELRADVVDVLRRSIIHDDNDILAINKPYGLATQDSKNDRHSTDSLLPQLAKSLRLDSQLYQVHRLDQNTTGVLLFAKTQGMQSKLINLFRKHEIVKKYWVLTKGVPEPTAGVIDVPMVEGTVAGRYRMTVSPDDPTQRRRYSDKSSRAVTKYIVLDSNNSAALVECETVMGLKHQIRCHLGFVLNCPILGDHKYSHFSKLAPQKLHPEILTSLGIRQAKVRHLPIHLHSSSIYIPKIIGDRGLFIKARLPSHFVENMKKLKLKTPKS